MAHSPGTSSACLSLEPLEVAWVERALREALARGASALPSGLVASLLATSDPQAAAATLTEPADVAPGSALAASTSAAFSDTGPPLPVTSAAILQRPYTRQLARALLQCIQGEAGEQQKGADHTLPTLPPLGDREPWSSWETDEREEIGRWQHEIRISGFAEVLYTVMEDQRWTGAGTEPVMGRAVNTCSGVGAEGEVPNLGSRKAAEIKLGSREGLGGVAAVCGTSGEIGRRHGNGDDSGWGVVQGGMIVEAADGRGAWNAWWALAELAGSGLQLLGLGACWPFVGAPAPQHGHQANRDDCHGGGPMGALVRAAGAALAGLGPRGVLALLGQRRSHQTVVEAPPPALDVLLEAFERPNRVGHSGRLTTGARALCKHAHRGALQGSYWPQATGKEVHKNAEARRALDRLLGEAVWANSYLLPGSGPDCKQLIFEVREIASNGARWTVEEGPQGHDGGLHSERVRFRGFLEPHDADGHAKRWRH